MKYYICEDVNDGEVVYVNAVDELEKGDLVVVVEFSHPVLAKVKGEMEELEAITSELNWSECLANVSMKEYYNKRKAQLEKEKLIKIMKAEMDLHSLEEKLKKSAEINPKMSDLFNKYKSLCESE